MLEWKRGQVVAKGAGQGRQRRRLRKLERCHTFLAVHVAAVRHASMSHDGMELRAIIFAVHTFSGGDQLVFRYPPIPNGMPESASDVSAKPQALPSTSPIGSSSRNLPTLPGLPYQLPSDLIAGLLIPKRQLCDRPFELRLDDTIFIGKPTLLTSEKDGSKSTQESGEGAARKYETPTVFNMVFVLDAQRA